MPHSIDPDCHEDGVVDKLIPKPDCSHIISSVIIAAIWQKTIPSSNRKERPSCWICIHKGRLKGRIEGKIEGQTELLLKQLKTKFKDIPLEMENKIKTLPAEKLEELAEAIFDFKSIDDVNAFI